MPFSVIPVLYFLPVILANKLEKVEKNKPGSDLGQAEQLSVEIFPTQFGNEQAVAVRQFQVFQRPSLVQCLWSDVVFQQLGFLEYNLVQIWSPDPAVSVF